jgi:haloalkane dehalogenase
MLDQGMENKLSEAERAAYLAPFPSSDYEWGLISFPLLIAVQPDNPGVPLNKAAWEKLCRFEKPFLTLFGELDPVAKGWEVRAQASIPGAKGQNHQIIPKAGHFIQEDAPEQLVAAITAFLAVS